jgi:hypothetical protein
MAKAPANPPLIGWRERVRLPLLGLGPLIAKIDTGARTAALHAEDITVRGRRVRFNVHGKPCEAALHGKRRVKNTSGLSETRAVILTEIKIGKTVFSAEVTLTDRTDMGVPMLLGRATIRGRYLVHPGKSFIISRKKAAAPA